MSGGMFVMQDYSMVPSQIGHMTSSSPLYLLVCFAVAHATPLIQAAFPPVSRLSDPYLFFKALRPFLTTSGYMLGSPSSDLL